MSCFSLKVCMLGDSDVGKSSLALRFAKNFFNSDLSNTVGGVFMSKMIKTKRGSQYKMEIWDTAGQERFRSLAPLFYRDAAVVLIVYSIVNRKSFSIGTKKWIANVQCSCPPNVVIILVGNKADLDSNRQIEVDEAQEFAHEIGATFYEASAKTGFNVERIFQDTCERFERENNQHLRLVCDGSERTFSVLSTTGEQIQPENVSLFGCCGS